VAWDGLSTELEGSLVRLEPLHARHEADLFEAAQDERIWRWLIGPGVLPTRELIGGWLRQAVVDSADGREAVFATVWRANDRAIGSSRFLTLRPEHRSLEIGWTWLSPATWRTGANVEAKLLMLGHAFERMGCQRVEFKTDARNERSRGALLALPAMFEGVLRRHMVMPYGPRDSAYYSVIVDEWPEVRANLRERLAAGESP
jgi:RimJ/RimL family protein N-acetyltransferase